MGTVQRAKSQERLEAPGKNEYEVLINGKRLNNLGYVNDAVFSQTVWNLYKHL